MAKKRIATFLGPQLGLSIAGTHAYAYSGVIGIDDNETTQLEFQTPDKVIRALVIFNSLTTDKIFTHTIYFNDQEVQSYISLTSGGRRHVALDLVIPPLTVVKCTSANTPDK